MHLGLLRSRRRRRESGSALIITLIVSLLLGLVLTSYLLLIRAQNLAGVRSQAWNAALTAAETGVEEALAKLNPTLFVTNVGVESGWTFRDGLVQLDKPRMLAQKPFEISYLAGYAGTKSLTIFATGYVTIPSIPATIVRSLRVTTTNAPLFTAGAVTASGIAMNGKDLLSDSYDSTDRYRSTGGKYDPAKVMQPRDGHGDIASNNGLTNHAALDIHGKLSVSPVATNKFAGNVSVSGGVRRDFNADFPDLPTPVLNGPIYSPRPGTNNGVRYTYALTRTGQNNYQTNRLNGSLYVAKNVDAILYVTGNINLSRIEIDDDATLTIYAAGASTVFQEVIVGGTPKSFQYFGLPGNTNISLMDYDLFTGTMYAPSATFRAGEKSSGDAFLDVDIYGALIVKAINTKSALKVHFDESLASGPANGPMRGFIVTSWKEISAP